MTKREIVSAYMNAEKKYEVCAHTNMGGYMEFMSLERVMFEDNAKDIADNYAKSWGKSENIKSICVRNEGRIIYETNI